MNLLYQFTQARFEFVAGMLSSQGFEQVIGCRGQDAENGSVELDGW